IAGENLDFVLGTDTKSAGPTDAAGNASAAPYNELQTPGSVSQVSVSFAGDATTNPALLPSNSSSPFSINKEDCTLAYTGDILVNAANPTTLSAQFGELDATHGDWTGKLVTFTVLDAALNPYGPFTASTDSSGLATTTAPLGPNVYTVSASFAGDDFYLNCAAADTLVTVQAANAKITGGGWISQTTGNTSFGFNVIQDVTGLKGQLQVRVKNGKDRFHSTSVLTLNSSGNSGTWTGTGRWDGITGYTFTVSVVDNGTSGKKGDTISIVIKSPALLTVFTTNGPQPLKGGNIVVH
ncbi:MAG TPA: post-COAP-1 domain-containing protein, partial [Candidatus Dormibacteraeota bacterium]|nr:post-COAP-1 domain-containing protein [Candidatus Dormibacteraeota bacterium]